MGATAKQMQIVRSKSDTKMHSSLKNKQDGGPFPDIEVERDIDQQRASNNDDDNRGHCLSHESDRGSNGNHKEGMGYQRVQHRQKGN